MAIDVDFVSERLDGRTVLWLEETDSTMNDAARLALMGAPSGTVVGAERQTAGQGRHGRTWHSPAGSGLYASLVLRVPLPPDQLPIVTMAVGVAVADAITRVTGVALDLRWPNDILIADRKLCGILIQHHHDALICGIGINVNQQSFPEDIAPIATSLRIAAGREFDREPILLEVLLSIDRHIDILVHQGKDPILQLFTRASSYVAGRRVVVDQGDQQLRGVTVGLDENGFLLLQQDNGQRTLILAGGVRPE